MGTRALVFDADARSATEIALRLSAAGMTVTVAPDTEAAFGLLRAGGYDIIVARGFEPDRITESELISSTSRERERVGLHPR